VYRSRSCRYITGTYLPGPMIRHVQPSTETHNLVRPHQLVGCGNSFHARLKDAGTLLLTFELNAMAGKIVSVFEGECGFIGSKLEVSASFLKVLRHASAARFSRTRGCEVVLARRRWLR
jgi:hypothetical protein